MNHPQVLTRVRLGPENCLLIRSKLHHIINFIFVGLLIGALLNLSEL
jgi:hypothetical protein